MTPEKTALLLIGFQNDYFAEDGALHGAIEDPDQFSVVLENTLDLIKHLAPTPATLISTPIVFTPGYRELLDPVGILKTVRDSGAFQSGNHGAETIQELLRFGARIVEVPGKRGLNAFADTDLDQLLRKREITHLAIAGVLTSVCVDSTSRHASELGYKVTILSDCTFGRNDFEQEFYCDKVFPLYAEVADHHRFLKSLLLEPKQDEDDEISGAEAKFLIQQRLFEELSAAEKRYRELVENLRNIVFQCDVEGRLTFVNQAWRDALGYSLEDAIGHLFSEFVICDLEDCSPETLLQESRLTRELRLRHRKGHALWFEMSLRRADDGGGVGLLYDITHQREREQQLREAMVAAQAGTEAKSRFLATMSHEIRTPMNGVLGMAELLNLTHLNKEQKDFVDTIRSSGSSLLSIINGILDYSKIESGNMSLERMPLDPRKVIQDITTLLGPKANGKSLSIEVNIDEAVPHIVLCDMIRLRQVLTNLLDNAIKFTEQGRIGIHLRNDESSNGIPRLRFEVNDTGVGIAPERQHHLFEPFTQEDSSTTRKYGGTGLGLAISSRLVELMGGRLRLESDINCGAKFYFAIPTPTPDTETDSKIPSQDAAMDPELAQRVPLKLLLAEDNAVNRDVITRMLKAMGYAPDSVVDGAEALAKANRKDYDLILMDLQMPRMGGLHAAEQILRTHRGKPPVIIAVTADATPEDRQACLDVGMSDFLLKPVQIIQLQSILELWGSGRG